MKKYEKIQNPQHYNSTKNSNIYEAINIIEEYKLNFSLGSAIKYILRAGKKPNESFKDDISKAIWYLNRELIKSNKMKVKIIWDVSETGLNYEEALVMLGLDSVFEVDEDQEIEEFIGELEEEHGKKIDSFDFIS